MKTHIPAKRKKGRWFCGPYAMGVVTGRSFEDIRAAVNDWRNRKPNTGVCGMWPHEINGGLERLGYGMNKVYGCGVPRERITLKKWLGRMKRAEGHVYIVTLSTHYVVVTDDWLIDNYTNGKVNIAYAPHLRSKVKAVYKAYRMNGAGWGN